MDLHPNRMAMTPSHLLIRADAGGALGTGHVMRMIALAQAWQERGGEVTIATGQCPPPVTQIVQCQQIGWQNLAVETLGDADDVQKCIELGAQLAASWIVLDGYHFGEDYQIGLKQAGFKVLAVDDYGHCETWHSDLVLNQNLHVIGAAKTIWNGVAQAACLAGPQFALLRREFRQWRPSASIQRNGATRILITFGGVDPTGAAVNIVAALNQSTKHQLELKVLAGPANPNLSALAVIAEKSPHAVELIPSTMDMPALYEWSDRVISAGGSSSYEWMRMRVPGWVTAVAMNQEQFVAAMLERGFAAGVASIDGLAPEALAALLNQWLDDPAPPQLGQIDGWGALRVAAAMADVPCWIRPVEVASDAEFLLSLANEPSVRNVGCFPAKIEMEQHLAWLNRHHASPSSRLMVIETLERGPVGQARFHEREPQVWEIGISILPAARMAGLAATALGLAMRAVSATTEVKTWLARIRKDNQASSRLFAKLGFVVRSDDGEMQNWELPNKINQPLKS